MKQCLGENENRKKIAFLLRIKKIQTINQMKVEKKQVKQKELYEVLFGKEN